MGNIDSITDVASEGSDSITNPGSEPVVNHSTPPVTTELNSLPINKDRDRIVILGRRRAGKTIFLARLYHKLWNSSGQLHMRAISGETHKACMQVVADLTAGQWPASTLGASYSDLEITYHGSKHVLVVLDYPGEVFRKAFVDNSDAEDAQELMDHVDRAKAVLLLLDPAVIHHASIDEAIDDDFGMVQAIHRIREWPGGDEIPIVAIFTKCDIRKRLLIDHGGLREFAVQNYPNLLRAVGRYKIFASSAVRAVSGKNGELVPSVTSEPIGLVEPLQYCLDKITEREEIKKEQKDAQYRLESYHKRMKERHLTRKKQILFWMIFWSSAMVILTTVAIVTWVLVNGPSS